MVTRLAGEFFDLLGEFVGAIAGLAEESFVVAGNFTQTPFDVAKNLLARRAQERIEALLSNAGIRFDQKRAYSGEVLFVLRACLAGFGGETLELRADLVCTMTSKIVLLFKAAIKFTRAFFQAAEGLFPRGMD